MKNFESLGVLWPHQTCMINYLWLRNKKVQMKEKTLCSWTQFTISSVTVFLPFPKEINELFFRGNLIFACNLLIIIKLFRVNSIFLYFFHSKIIELLLTRKK
jgi:hypothetical protein